MPQVQTPTTVHSDEGDFIDHFPAGDVYGGDVVLIGNVVHVSLDDIAANAKGALKTRGVFKAPKTTAAWTAGLRVFWDPTGDPDGGSAGTGAFTQTPTPYPAGYTYVAAGAGDDYGYLWLNGTPPGMPIVPTATLAAAGSVQGDAALVAAGFTLVTGADATKGVKLPLASPGLRVEIKNSDAANAILKIWPNTSDAINALGANNSFSIAAKTSVTLVAYDATTWYSIPLLPS